VSAIRTKRPRSGTRFSIAIATPHGARAVEYVIAMCDLDGQAYVVAIATEVKGLV